MNSIMQSIKPQYCELIAAGKKTIEVRKTRPKLKPPFKVYIYATRPKQFFSISAALRTATDYLYMLENGTIKFGDGLEDYDKRVKVLNGKVIGEYICDEIRKWVFNTETNSYNISDDDLALTCLTQEQLWEYGKGKTLYGYHITNLKIYDEPKELNKFYTICNKDDLDQCGDCKYIESYSASFPCEDGGDWWCTVDNKKPLTRPFQSWGYVYEID